MINNVTLVSGVQQSDSVIHTHVCILFQILFPSRSLQCIEQSSLWYTVGPCWLCILYVVVFISLAPPPFSFGNHKFVFHVYSFLTENFPDASLPTLTSLWSLLLA